MKRLLFALLIAVSTLAVPSITFANDASFGGRGADPMPLENDKVAMVEEHIVLRADETRSVWDVTCEFTFENTTDEEVKLKIGFPFPTNDDEGDVSIPAGKKYPNRGEALVWDFKSWVRGKPVKVARKKVAENDTLPDIQYGTVFLWDVTFKPKEKIKIKNTYVHGISADSMGTTWISYVLKTGSLWKGGKIGRSRLEVHASESMLLPPADLAVGYVTFARKPAGARVVQRKDGVSLYWDLKKFAPKEDLHVDFVRRDMAWYLLGLNFGDEQLAKMSKKELRIARNSFSAVHGYVFKSKDLQKHFAKQWWYRPNPDFELKELGQHERDMMKKIAALEKTRD